MPASRNQIFDALLALAGTITWTDAPGQFAYLTRRPRTPDKMRGFMPACCQAEYRTSTTQTRGMPQRRVFEAAWLIMHYAADDDAVPARITSDILDAVDGLFPEIGGPGFGNNPQTLGGLVHSVKISGATETFGGNVDAQVLIVVPLQIIAP